MQCDSVLLDYDSVSKKIFSGILHCTDAATLWDDFKERFKKVNGSRIFSLHREIGRLNQGTNYFSTYYSKMSFLWDEFASLVILPSCDCESARKYVEHDRQHRLLQF